MTRARPSRDEIIERYRACVSKLGTAPGLAMFCRTAGVARADVLYYWPRMTDLTREAGSKPNVFRKAHPDADVFIDYARVCLQLTKIPTKGELRIATRHLGTRTSGVYTRFGSIAEFDRRFREWLASGSEEFKIILTFPGWNRGGPLKSATGRAPLLAVRPFLPAGLQYLDALARGELPPGELSDSPVNVQFERKCADAFQTLGFEVRQLGQGKGRAPDILAIAKRFNYGVIVDAKVRRDGYKLGTEDRTFHEYVVRYSLQLNEEGIEKVYLSVIASRFRESDHPKLVEYLSASAIRGVTFFSASALMRLVEESIRDRATFSLAEFEKILFAGRVVAA